MTSLSTTNLGRRVLIYLLLLMFSITTVFPFVWMVSTSFKSPSAVFTVPPKMLPDRVFTDEMWDNYDEVLTKHNFVRYTFNSFFVATMAGLGQLVTSSLAGFAFARMKFRGRDVLFALLLFTAFVPDEVTIVPEYLMGARLFHPFMELFGSGWLDTYYPLIIPSFMVGTFGTFLMREFFSTIPKELEEAAVIDGAGTFRIYWRIFVPLSGPMMTTLFLIAFINNWNALLRPVLYISSRDLRTVTMGLTQFQSDFEAQWHLLLTGSVISIVPLVIIYIFLQRYIVQGMATTGLKG